jgi:carbon-monoxide dehydrogenase small subunit
MNARHRVAVSVNGERHEAEIEARLSLLDFLRDELGLLGTHAGCEHGVCGTCTVLVDGRSARACLVLAVQAHGAAVETVEGLAVGGELGPLQQAFWNRQALQCGFCTPGMLMRATEILRLNPAPTAEEVREGLASNLCRCTGYAFIIEAVLEAAAALRAARA